jgi:hypothetical protein
MKATFTTAKTLYLARTRKSSSDRFRSVTVSEGDMLNGRRLRGSRSEPSKKPKLTEAKTAEANINLGLVLLTMARGFLFRDMGSMQRARRNARIRETEYAICDAIRVADGRR